MALVLMETQPWGYAQRQIGNIAVLLPYEPVHIANTNGTAATTYGDQNSGSPTTADLTTLVTGAIPGYIAPGQYDVTIRGVTVRVQALSYEQSQLRGNATSSDYLGEPGMLLQDIGYFGTGYLAVSGRPQVRRLKAVYRDPTTADSAQGDSVQTVFPDTGSAKTQTLPATGGESDVIVQNNWNVTGQSVGHSFSIETQDGGHTAKTRPVYVAAKAARDAGSTVDDWVGIYVEDPSTGSAGTITLKTGIHSKPRIQTETGLIVGLAEAAITSAMRSSTLYLVGTNATNFPAVKIVKKSGSTDDILQIADSGANPQILVNQAGQLAIKTSGAAHSFGSGVGAMVALGNITTIPSANYTGGAGGFLYVEAGALKYRGGAGTVTILGAA